MNSLMSAYVKSQNMQLRFFKYASCAFLLLLHLIASLKRSIAETYTVVLVVTHFCLKCVNKTPLYSPYIAKITSSYYFTILNFLFFATSGVSHSMGAHFVSKVW